MWALSSRLTVAFLIVLCVRYGIAARPVSFDNASPEAQEFVVDCLAKAIGKSDILLVRQRMDDVAGEVPWRVASELNLSEWRLVARVKGQQTATCGDRLYLYDSKQRYENRTAFCIDKRNDTCRFYCAKTKRMVSVRGKEVWRFVPPYDPFVPNRAEFVELMFLTPEKEVDLSQIDLVERYRGKASVSSVVDGCVTNWSPLALMKALNVETVFSNCVFRMNDGCAFQVDYQCPDFGKRMSLFSDAELEKQAAKNQENCNSLIHLSSEEVSEIVYLACLFDSGDGAFEYDQACSRVSKLLQPVAGLHTNIGKRVYMAMKARGGRVEDAGL